MQAKHWFESGRKKLITGHLSKTNPNTELFRVLNIADKDYSENSDYCKTTQIFILWLEGACFLYKYRYESSRVSVWIQSKEDN